MKPAPFTYHDPSSVHEATEMLASLENARVLAGGQSLMAMMNFRYAMPDHLVDLNRIDALSYLRFENDSLHIGAMTRQRHRAFRRSYATLSGAARSTASRRASADA